MPTKNPKPQSFRGTLEHLQSGLGWVIVRIPFDVKRTWGGSRVKIRGAVNGATFRTSLFAQKNGSHFLLINKQLQKAAGIRAGSTAEFHLEVDTAPRLATVPQELERIFQQSKRLRKWFDSLSYSYRYEFSRQISLPKGAETRKRRAEQIAELLLETMEAERELPPLIKTALDQNPLAREGWNVMTPTQRRGHLMGVFYYRTPEARARRLQKAMEAAKTARSRRAS
ncbi:MAG: YdeI/OmpD-associated family protein [Terriglobales bacterium]|jgi:uncharacterized protein YdeI (YjbR/CyaY-like superfamily)